jgi:hypothetical protein
MIRNPRETGNVKERSLRRFVVRILRAALGGSLLDRVPIGRTIL